MQLRGVEVNELAILRIKKGLRLVTDYEVRALVEIFDISMEELYP